MANIQDYLVLYLPFDEPQGSAVAYDYSASRLDAAISGGADFVSGKVGNAIHLPGAGKGVVSSNPLDFSGDFTVSVLVKGNKSSREADTNPKKIGWLVNLSGVNAFLEFWVDLAPDVWTHAALVRYGHYLRYYVNGALIEEQNLSGTIIGISLNQDFYGEPYGLGDLDELQLYSKALSQEELLSLFDNSVRLEYYLDGLNLKDHFHVRVSDSRGVIDGLKMKSPFAVEFGDENGEFVDLESPVFEPRDISLDCWIKAEGKSDFVDKVHALETVFRSAGTHRLMIITNPTKPLVYEVYMPNGLAVSKKWRDDLMIGTFTLNLREPEPVKRVLKHIVVNASTKTCTINLTSDRCFNIYWGDGSADYDIGGTGESVTVTHTYAENGDYYPIITGVVKEITAFSTNAIVVWSEL